MSTVTARGAAPLKTSWLTPSSAIAIRVHGRDAEAAKSTIAVDYFFAGVLGNYAAISRRATFSALGSVGAGVTSTFASTTRRNAFSATGSIDTPTTVGSTTRRNVFAAAGAAEARGPFAATTRRNAFAAAGVVGAAAGATGKKIIRMRRARRYTSRGM